MAYILKGSPVAASINENAKKLCDELKSRNIYPKLAVVRVGEREDDISYERNVIKRCEKLGVQTVSYLFTSDVTQAELLDTIQRINSDNLIHSCLMFRPLPKHINENLVRNALLPEKDADGITDLSLSGVFTNRNMGFPPCTAQACIEILNYYNFDLTSKRAVVIGRSLVVGKPVAMMLDAKNATVTMCNSKTQNLDEICKQADVIVVAMGRMKAIGSSFVHENQTVIDVGIHVTENGKLCGDVNFDEVEPIVNAITPVPGGVGTVTTAVLVSHVVQAANRLSK